MRPARPMLPPLLPVWMGVISLILWLWDFHSTWFLMVLSDGWSIFYLCPDWRSNPQPWHIRMILQLIQLPGKSQQFIFIYFFIKKILSISSLITKECDQSFFLFNHKRMLNFIKYFSTSIEMTVWFFFFTFLIWQITSIDYFLNVKPNLNCWYEHLLIHSISFARFRLQLSWSVKGEWKWVHGFSVPSLLPA